MKFDGDFNFKNDMDTPKMESGCKSDPVVECPEERVCHRYIMHEVPHVKPMNTKIINHHVYRHTFTPVFSCCEEDVVENVFDNGCGK